jgi:3-oxoacyl-[acyl-carrier protein] reductase/pteridine reductase
MFRLEGERVLVTGAARRIGRALALSLAEAGAAVAITYRNSTADAESTLAELRALGGRAHAVYCDLNDAASIAVAVNEAAELLGGLTVVVNNAGAFETAPLESLSVEQWDAMFATNTRAPFLVAQAALPHLRAHAADKELHAGRGAGRIINIGSLGGQHPWATHAHYCASKAALHMLTLTMAKAFAPEVAVNCVAPGMIVTGEEVSADYAHFLAKTPMGRNGTTRDVAEAVCFLAGATPFITGQILTVDGGLGL